MKYIKIQFGNNGKTMGKYNSMWFLIAGILLVSFIIRTQNINRPLLDAHYFRQTQTATVVRNFQKSGIDPFHTKLDIFGDGKEQVLLLEFPFYQMTVAAVSYLLGFQDYVGRIVALIFAIFSGLVLVLLVNKLTSDKIVAVISLVFFLFSPLNFYFQQAYMIESSVIFFHLLSLYIWLIYTRKKNDLWLFMAAFITGIAFILKIVYAPFMLLPILAILFFKLDRKEFMKFNWLPGIIIALLITFGWQHYVDVTNKINGHGNYQLTDSSQQLWNFGLIAERANMNIWIARINSIQNNVTKYQWPVFLFGMVILVLERKKEMKILLVWLFSMIIYYTVLFRIQSHDYYFMPVMPVINIIAALGLIGLVRLIIGLADFTRLGFVLLSIYLSLFAYKSVQNAKMYFQIDTNMEAKLKNYNSVIGGKGNILFIFPQYDWNSVYSYYTGHKGTVLASDNVSSNTIERYADLGYRYAVIDGITAVNEMNLKYPCMAEQFTKLKSSGEMVILGI